jgi:hypothetical protein
MLPKYDDGDVILVWRETKKPIESFYGREAIVRTSDGHRYIKTILYGKTRAVVNLQSFNAKLIEGVRLEWIGEIYSVIRGDQIKRLDRLKSRSSQRSPSSTTRRWSCRRQRRSSAAALLSRESLGWGGDTTAPFLRTVPTSYFASVSRGFFAFFQLSFPIGTPDFRHNYPNFFPSDTDQPEAG